MNTFKGLSEEETKACIRFYLEYGQHMARFMPWLMAWSDFWKGVINVNQGKENN